MHPLATVFALLTGAAGWFYLFYSRAAQGLAGIEQERINRLRVGLRRIGGVLMILLAVLFFVGFNTFDPQENPDAFVATWITVLLLLATILVLALIDVRLTFKLRKRPRRGIDIDPR